jgi:hypothetical protein
MNLKFPSGPFVLELGSGWTGNTAHADFKCRNKRFRVEVAAQSLPGDLSIQAGCSLGLEEKFSKLLHQPAQDTANPDLVQFLLEAALPQIQSLTSGLAPTNPAQLQTVFDFYEAEYIHLRVFDRNGSWDAERLGPDQLARAGLSETGWPFTLHLSESRLAAQRFHQDGGLPLAWVQGVKRIPASELIADISHAPNCPNTFGCHDCQAYPKHVIHRKGGTRFYLKVPDVSTRDEFPYLVKLRRWGRDLQTWRLAALVTPNEDSDDIIAMLMEPKENTRRLDAVQPQTTRAGQALREKWARQVEEMMRGLLDIGLQLTNVTAAMLESDVDGKVLLTKFTGLAEYDCGEDVAAAKKAMLDALACLKRELGVELPVDEALWDYDDDDEADETYEVEDEDEDESSDDELMDESEEDTGRMDVEMHGNRFCGCCPTGQPIVL